MQCLDEAEAFAWSFGRAQQAEDSVAAEDRNRAHIEHVGPQRHKPSVLQKERLSNDHRCHSQQAGHGPQQDAEERTTHKVARCSAKNGKVQHLRREDEGRQNSHDRNHPPGKLALHAARRIKDARTGQTVQRHSDSVRKKSIRHMHGSEL